MSAHEKVPKHIKRELESIAYTEMEIKWSVTKKKITKHKYMIEK